MKVIEALEARQSTRAFLDKPVSREQLTRILTAASHSPSGANAQPWQVAVVSGEKKRQLCGALEKAFAEGGVGEMEYHYYPERWPGPCKARRFACGLQLYQALGIERHDHQARMVQWAANYRAFDAPVVLFFFLDRQMEKGSFLDYGMFLQSLMLAAQAEGLATCAQAALGQFPEIIKESLGYGQETLLLCGMALGYADPGAPINQYRTPREEVETFTRFFS
jgi:nitroreductase